MDIHNEFTNGSRIVWLTHLRQLIIEGKTGQAARQIDETIAFIRGFDALEAQSPNHYEPNSTESAAWHRGYDAAVETRNNAKS